MKIPFLLVDPARLKGTWVMRLPFNRLLKFFPELDFQLEYLEIHTTAKQYAAASFLSSCLYGFFFAILIFLVLFVITPLTSEPVVLSLVSKNAGFVSVAETSFFELQLNPLQFLVLRSILFSAGFIFLFFLLHLVYPMIIANQIIAKQNKDLLFALREVTMGIESGLTLFEAIRNISIGDYGYVSRDFNTAVRKIESGYSEKASLKHLAIESKNEFLKRSLWQVVNSLESGAKVNVSLVSVIDALEKKLLADIKAYSASLNFIMLIYMMIAAAVPSLGITFLILLSSFSGVGIDATTIYLLLGGSVFMQIAIIGFVSTSRPEVIGG